MNIICDHNCLRKLDANERNNFKTLYDTTPVDFMYQCRDWWQPDDLTGKYVISVEQKISKPKFDSDGIYCFNILGIYTPKENQIAKLAYYAHIAFVEIMDDRCNPIALLYKDDECYPQTLKEWYEMEYEEFINNSDEEDYFFGRIPTKEQVIDLIELFVKAHYQNPEVSLNIKEDDVIILQGL